MLPQLRWPLNLTHTKCNSNANVVPTEVSVQRDGKLVIKCGCYDCDEEYVLIFSLLELCSEAAIADRETFKDNGDLSQLPGIWTAYPNPN